MRWRLPVLLGIVLLLAALARWLPGARPGAASGESPPPLTVGAASDLQLAFPVIGRQFEAKTGRQVLFSFASSATLARQVEQGAPLDVVAMANEAYLDQLARQGLIIPDTREIYAVGRIVLVSSPRAGFRLTSLAELLDGRVARVAIANPEHAPYGQAAREALQRAGLWERVRPKLVFAENIAQALQFVRTGNAEAGIVALSVVQGSGLPYVLIDGRYHTPLRQAMGVVRGTPRAAAARAFVDFVAGPEGQAILQRYGFAPPGER